MVSTDEFTTNLWVANVRTANQHMTVGAIRSTDMEVRTTIPMLYECMIRARAVGANVWETPLRKFRITLQMVTIANQWLDRHTPTVTRSDPLVASAVDQLIAETAPTETPS